MSRKSDDNNRTILFFAVLAAIVVCVLLVYSGKAKAGERTSYEQDLVTDFIESERKCAADTVMCERVLKLCPLVVKRKTALFDFIWNEYPFRTKNGGMNITARFTRALRKCE